MLAFSRTVWPTLDIIDDFTIQAGATVFHGAQSSPFIYKDGICYGCSTASRTDADQFALADITGSQVPCKIIYHYQISVGSEKPLVCSIIQQLVSDYDMPQFPWDR